MHKRKRTGEKREKTFKVPFIIIQIVVKGREIGLVHTSKVPSIIIQIVLQIKRKRESIREREQESIARKTERRGERWALFIPSQEEIERA